jgi:hypothetical protein
MGPGQELPNKQSPMVHDRYKKEKEKKKIA